MVSLWVEVILPPTPMGFFSEWVWSLYQPNVFTLLVRMAQYFPGIASTIAPGGHPCRFLLSFPTKTASLGLAASVGVFIFIWWHNWPRHSFWNLECNTSFKSCMRRWAAGSPTLPRMSISGSGNGSTGVFSDRWGGDCWAPPPPPKAAYLILCGGLTAFHSSGGVG